MDIYRLVEEDINDVYRCWAKRNVEYYDRSRLEFEQAVEPRALYRSVPDMAELHCVNVCYTEWFLFEFELGDGMAPIACHIENPPSSVPEGRLERLRQVVATQRFSRFSIGERSPATGDAVLCDLRRSGATCEYPVHVPQLFEHPRWQNGSLALRIACVGGLWMRVGKLLAYDRVPASRRRGRQPGEIGDEILVGLAKEGWSFVSHQQCGNYFLDFLHDIMGITGPYADSFQVVA